MPRLQPQLQPQRRPTSRNPVLPTKTRNPTLSLRRSRSRCADSGTTVAILALLVDFITRQTHCRRLSLQLRHLRAKWPSRAATVTTTEPPTPPRLPHRPPLTAASHPRRRKTRKTNAAVLVETASPPRAPSAIPATSRRPLPRRQVILLPPSL